MNIITQSLLLIILFVFPVVSYSATPLEVTNVAVHDVLNMRLGAGVHTTIIAKLPYNAEVSSNNETKKVGETLWQKITWQGITGWVNQAYLRPKSGEMLSFACVGTEPFWSIDLTGASMAVSLLGEPVFTLPRQLQKTPMNAPQSTKITSAFDDKHTVVLMTYGEMCSDGMSDTDYPYRALVLIDNQQTYAGCCK